jgi:hypothetical protein
VSPARFTKRAQGYGAEKLEALVAGGILAAPPGTPSLDAVAPALAAVTRRSDEDPAFAEFGRPRHALIRTYAELRERELAKLASLASATAATLRRRGVSEPAASLAAEAGVAAFKGRLRAVGRRPQAAQDGTSLARSDGRPRGARA